MKPISQYNRDDYAVLIRIGHSLAQLTGAAEYTYCIAAEE